MTASQVHYNLGHLINLKLAFHLISCGDEFPGVAEYEQPADVERDGGELLLPALVDLTLGRRAI